MNKDLVGGGVHWDGDFSRWEECANFQLVGGRVGALSNQNLKCTVFRGVEKGRISNEWVNVTKTEVL